MHVLLHASYTLAFHSLCTCHNIISMHAFLYYKNFKGITEEWTLQHGMVLARLYTCTCSSLGYECETSRSNENHGPEKQGSRVGVYQILECYGGQQFRQFEKGVL